MSPEIRAGAELETVATTLVLISRPRLDQLVQEAKLGTGKAFRSSRRTQAVRARSSSSTNSLLLLSIHTNKLPQGVHSETMEGCVIRQRPLRSRQDQAKPLVRPLHRAVKPSTCHRPSRVSASTALKRQDQLRAQQEAKINLEAAARPSRMSISACESIKEATVRTQAFRRPSSRARTQMIAPSKVALQNSKARRHQHSDKV